jgi:hypothetical protein
MGDDRWQGIIKTEKRAIIYTMSVKTGGYCLPCCVKRGGHNSRIAVIAI